MQWWPRRARGGAGADEFDEDGRRSEVEDDGDGGDAGAPAVHFSARRKRWSRRISWVLRVAVRSTVATANGVGDDELRSGACREESRGENGVQGKRGEVQGRGEVRGVRGRLGNASVEAGGGRGGIGARHRAASVRGEEEDKGEGGGGLGQREALGRLQVSGPGTGLSLSLSYNSVLFYLFYFLQFVFD